MSSPLRLALILLFFMDKESILVDSSSYDSVATVVVVPDLVKV